jgi:diguanylate cyclase (GGDEF)-like protein/PAS domain S-box-containing protein
MPSPSRAGPAAGAARPAAGDSDNLPARPSPLSRLVGLPRAAVDWVLGHRRAIAELQAKSEELRRQTDLLKFTNKLAAVGGWEFILPTQQLLWSEQVYHIHGLPVGTPIDVKQAIDFYAPEDRLKIQAALAAAIATGESYDLELQLTTATGRSIWVRSQGECVRQGGVPYKLSGAFQDITDRKLAEEQLLNLATHDKLTGLPNRTVLNDRLQECMSLVAKRPDHLFGLLFLDFDRFKLTNDTLGHEAGDELLRQIAKRLRTGVRGRDPVGRPNDLSCVSRLGGDEFVVILDNIGRPQNAMLVANRLLKILAEPYRLFGHDVVSTASIGIVTSTAAYTRPEEMLRDADIAMYEAKLAGKGRYVVFDAAMQKKLQRRMDLEIELRAAITSDQVSLVYQPLVNLQDGRPIGAEALVRWHRPAEGLIASEEWMPIAEETGLIVPLGQRVLREACAQFVTWQAELREQAPQCISVNVSRKQLLVGDFVQQVRQILDQTEMPAPCLHLEISEGTIMNDPATLKTVLLQLRRLGVKLNMDDFGTGQSSLGMLHEFPIDVLKINGTFITNMNRGREFIAVVQAITQLARNLGMAVVAEGVQSVDELVVLQTFDCELGQGYYLGRPMTADAFANLLRGDEQPEPMALAA